MGIHRGMCMAFDAFFHCICKAVVKKGISGLMGEKPFAQRVNSIAIDIHDRFERKFTPEQWIAEMEGCARATVEQVHIVAMAAYDRYCSAAQEETLERLSKLEVREKVLAYLEQVPGMVRSLFRRPADPEGLSVPPGFVVEGPSDILKILPARPPRYKAGEMPVGNWRLVDLLGMGAFGEVWKAEHPTLKGIMPVALKFCLTPDLARYIRHESELLSRIMELSGNNPGIVRLQQAWLDCDPPCLEYEFVNGGDLCGLMSEWLNLSGQRRVLMALQMLLKLARTVAPLHALQFPIVHRDLKPANVLVTRKPEGKIDLKIADFGIGGLAIDHGFAEYEGTLSQVEILTRSLRGSHTPLYASLEQRKGEVPHPADDVHALGVIGFQLLVCDLGRAPTGDWDNELKEMGISIEAIRLLRKCFARRTNRFQNGNEMAQALEALLADPQTIGNFDLLDVSPMRGRQPIGEFPSGTMDPWLTRLPNRPVPEKIEPEILMPPLKKTFGAEPSRKAKEYSGYDAAPVRRSSANLPVKPIPVAVEKPERPAEPVKQNLGMNWVLLVILGIVLFLFPAIVTFLLMQPVPDSVRRAPESPPRAPDVLDRMPREPREAPQAVRPPVVLEAAAEEEKFPDITPPVNLPKNIMLVLAPNVTLPMVLVPAGKFTMGSPPDEPMRDPQEVPHDVQITQPFYMAVTETTQIQYRTIMRDADQPVPNMPYSPTWPANNVSYSNAILFCRQLSERFEHPFTLPTEAQWEYACRAGKITPYGHGDKLNGMESNVNGSVPFGAQVPGPNQQRVVTVRSYLPNDYGIYDMHGNVWEWCSDWHGDYDLNNLVDPMGPSNGIFRVKRGGSWFETAGSGSHRSACRGPLDGGHARTGFRMVLSAQEYRADVLERVKVEQMNQPIAPLRQPVVSTVLLTELKAPPTDPFRFVIDEQAATAIVNQKLTNIVIGKYDSTQSYWSVLTPFLDSPIKGRVPKCYKFEIRTQSNQLIGYAYNSSKLVTDKIYKSLYIYPQTLRVAVRGRSMRIETYYVVAAVQK